MAYGSLLTAGLREGVCCGRAVVAGAAGAARRYSGGCRGPPCGCPNKVPGQGRRIVPPADCKPRSVPYNPCCPTYHTGNDSKKYKYITFFVGFPLIIFMMVNLWGHEPPHKCPCRDFEFMRIRTKRFPWGSGVESLFHNPHVNHLPGECVPPDPPCD